jgi:hypothetical protein
MTRKDYELIAGAVGRSAMASSLSRNAVKRAAAEKALRLVAGDLAATLAHDNPLFDRERFMCACGF